MPKNWIGGPRAGVYVIHHAVDTKKVWVGEATDCVRRTQFAAHMGLRWQQLLLLPDSTKEERLFWETAIAMEYEHRGFIMCANYGKGGALGPRTTVGRVSPTKGLPVPTERIKRIVASRKGYRHSAATRTKIGDKHRGRKHGEEQRSRMGKGMLGKKHTAATRRKMAASHSQRHSS